MIAFSHDYPALTGRVNVHPTRSFRPGPRGGPGGFINSAVMRIL